MRWRPILCLWGLVLFGLLTFASLQVNRAMLHDHGRYFWWGSVRLDSDPLNERPASKLWKEGTQENCPFVPEFIWVTPGWMETALTLSAFPAFLLTIAVVRGLAHLGISELLSFMITMPILILVWFYAVGWLLDRWRYKRLLLRPSVNPSST